MTYFHSDKEFIVCNKTTVEEIKHHIYLLTLFLRETTFLTEAYILDFFVENLWNQIPFSWKNIIEGFEISDLEDFLTAEKDLKYCQPWPLSLMSFRASAFALSLQRKSIKATSKVIDTLLHNINEVHENMPDDNLWNLASSEFELKSGQHKIIPEFCRRHVKPKKQHEIFRMSELLNHLLKCYKIKHIVDVGAGQGHLSRLLAFCYNFNVATIELNQCNVIGAKNYDQQALNQFKKKMRNMDEFICEKDIDVNCLPLHLKGNMTVSSAKECLEHVQNLWLTENVSKHKFALLGLHTCGSLAETILKTFVNCKESEVVISVGCCYMKLNSEESYPLSTFLKSCENNSLSYEAKELACHALEMFLNRLHENASSLKIHCYRATLETCIIKCRPDLKHLGLRGVKHAEKLRFSDYAEKALSKVGITIPIDILTSCDVDVCLKSWKKVLIFYTLRLITAPVIESLILLDRLLYLFEKGYEGCICPIFDPVLSPRNYVILASKKIF